MHITYIMKSVMMKSIMMKSIIMKSIIMNQYWNFCKKSKKEDTHQLHYEVDYYEVTYYESILEFLREVKERHTSITL